jgi:MtN3 and saliva related transmembrane protein
MLEISPHVMGTAATVYGVGAAAAALLQARQVLRRGRSCDVSARFFASYVGGYAIWLLYGVSIGSMPLILVDLVGLLCGGLTLAITLALRGSLLSPTSWNSCPE